MALAVVLLAVKTHGDPFGKYDPSKLLKYAAYEFTVEQICMVEVKVFTSLEWGSDLSFAKDDLFNMI